MPLSGKMGEKWEMRDCGVEMMEKRKRKNGKMGTNRAWFGVKKKWFLLSPICNLEMGNECGNEGRQGRGKEAQGKGGLVVGRNVWHCMNANPPPHTRTNQSIQHPHPIHHHITHHHAQYHQHLINYSTTIAHEPPVEESMAVVELGF